MQWSQPTTTATTQGHDALRLRDVPVQVHEDPALLCLRRNSNLRDLGTALDHCIRLQDEVTNLIQTRGGAAGGAKRQQSRAAALAVKTRDAERASRDVGEIFDRIIGDDADVIGMDLQGLEGVREAVEARCGGGASHVRTLRAGLCVAAAFRAADPGSRGPASIVSFIDSPYFDAHLALVAPQTPFTAMSRVADVVTNICLLMGPADFLALRSTDSVTRRSVDAALGVFGVALLHLQLRTQNRQLWAAMVDDRRGLLQRQEFRGGQGVFWDGDVAPTDAGITENRGLVLVDERNWMTVDQRVPLSAFTDAYLTAMMVAGGVTHSVIADKVQSSTCVVGPTVVPFLNLAWARSAVDRGRIETILGGLIDRLSNAAWMRRLPETQREHLLRSAFLSAATSQHATMLRRLLHEHPQTVAANQALISQALDIAFASNAWRCMRELAPLTNDHMLRLLLQTGVLRYPPASPEMVRVLIDAPNMDRNAVERLLDDIEIDSGMNDMNAEVLRVMADHCGRPQVYDQFVARVARLAAMAKYYARMHPGAHQ